MTRKKKTEETIDEEANRKALDAAAGVPVLSKEDALPRSSETTEEWAARVREGRPVAGEVTRPANAAPLVKTDTREKLLYKIACTGTPLGDEFFDKFPDRQEILELSLDLSARLLIVAIFSDMPVTQRIASMRVVASLAGKNVPDPEDDKFTRPAPLTIPRGSKEEVANTLDKIRQLSQ